MKPRPVAIGPGRSLNHPRRTRHILLTSEPVHPDQALAREHPDSLADLALGSVVERVRKGCEARGRQK